MEDEETGTISMMIIKIRLVKMIMMIIKIRLVKMIMMIIKIKLL